ncbi:MAG: hypothetical protein J7K15_07480 [Deltaproteobacteria bacterium]|nr:hypothetical protein [Deltaproteobacteria bacterium]
MMAMKNWMAELALYYEKTRSRYSHDRLLIVFDIARQPCCNAQSVSFTKKSMVFAPVWSLNNEIDF